MMLNLNSPENQKMIVIELDSALNAFLDDIPAHLRWDPTMKDELHFQQSTMLYSMSVPSLFLLFTPLRTSSCFRALGST